MSTPSNRHKPAPAGGQITAMQFQQRNKGRVNLFIDGEFALALPALDAARLKIGQALSAADVARLQQLGEQHLLYDKALRFLSYRPRSEAELRRFLRAKSDEEAHSAAITEKLRALGHLDDRAFARWWLENRAAFSPRGSYALRSELRRKGVADAIITEVLAEFQPDTDETIEAAARARARRLAGEDKPAFRRKLSAFLLRRGYTYQDVTPIVERLWQTLAEERATIDKGERE